MRCRGRRDAGFHDWEPGRTRRDDRCEDLFLGQSIERYLQSLATNSHNIENMSDLIEYLKENPAEKVEEFGIDGFERARDALQNLVESPSNPTVRRSFQTSLKQGREIQRLLDSHDADAILVPTSADIPYDLGQNPAITVPISFYPEETDKSISPNGMTTKAFNIPSALPSSLSSTVACC